MEALRAAVERILEQQAGYGDSSRPAKTANANVS
jgi:hypothetical protein